ncbi:MAG: cell wall-binding repeat-containing protein [Varibaculum sp.]|nr:cell wall-binding repeat-containing protein [Varibaculum sp.]
MSVFNTRIARCFTVTVLSILIAVTGIITAPHAAAATGLEGFDYGYLIDDSLMYGAAAASTMTDAQIQSFLNEKGANCKNGKDGSPCLKNARFKTVTLPASSWCPGSYTGSNSDSAAAIIGKSARACNINPQVLLVILQKEQGLVTTTNPSAYAYQKATGFACPDTAPCNSQYAGFAKQVYSAASRLQQYRIQPYSFNHRAGITKNISYHPKTSCGSLTVNIRNAATAALYNYTPLVPNAAALRAVTGLGDSCSSYGNRNFYRMFATWFGAPNSGATVTKYVSNCNDRIWGATRVETSIGIGRCAYPNGSKVAYLASAISTADALAAGSLTDGPVILNNAGSLDTSVKNYLLELRGKDLKTVYLLGGTGVLSGGVESQLRSLGFATGRLAGTDRYGTAVSIARHVFPNGFSTAYVTDGVGDTGLGSPDAVVGGTLTAGPLLFGTRKNGFDNETSVLLSGKQTVQLGGNPLGSFTPNSYLFGTDRYATAVEIAKAATNPQTHSIIYLANGQQFVDAVAGGELVNGRILLTTYSSLPTSTCNYIKISGASKVVALGGTGAVSQNALNQARSCLR